MKHKMPPEKRGAPWNHYLFSYTLILMLTTPMIKKYSRESSSMFHSHPAPNNNRGIETTLKVVLIKKLARFARSHRISFTFIRDG